MTDREFWLIVYRCLVALAEAVRKKPDAGRDLGQLAAVSLAEAVKKKYLCD